jgi:Cu/Zn superoxide dismutase
MGRAAYSLVLALAACGPQGGVAEKVEDDNGLKEILPPPPSGARTDAQQAPSPRRVTGPLVATVTGTPEHASIRGTVRFVPTAQGVDLETSVEGLPPGAHAYHVHMYGDCSDATAKSPGPHLDFATLGPVGAVGDRTRPSGHVVHPEQPKATADGQLVPNNSTSGAPGGAPGADAADVATRGIGNPNAAPPNSRPETATRGTGMGSGDAGNRGSPGTPTTASNSSAGSTTHPPGSPPDSTIGGTTGGAAGTSGAPVAGDPAPGHPMGAGDRVLGNLGELVAKEGQAVTMHASLPQLAGADLEGLLGRAVVIHEHPNDPNVPDGAAGTPIACGVIGVANPTPLVTGSNRTGASGPGRASKQQGTP